MFRQLYRQFIRCGLTAVLILQMTGIAAAHHILGRSASGLSEDSNTPSSLQEEIQIGDYLVNYMIFPAFPKPEEPGQINVTAERTDSGEAFDGKVTFAIQENAWYAALGFGSDERILGVQAPDDHVFRQRLVFPGRGEYLITIRFEDNGEPYVIQFSVHIGEAAPVSVVTMAIIALAIALVLISLIQRRRLMSGKVRQSKPNQA
ncbi:MAG: hypothetical protein VCE75_03750 [Alphaproteobacteria bacterium]